MPPKGTAKKREVKPAHSLAASAARDIEDCSPGTSLQSVVANIVDILTKSIMPTKKQAEGKSENKVKVAPIHHPAEPATRDECTHEAIWLSIESIRACNAEVTVLAIQMLLGRLEAHNEPTGDLRLMVAIDEPLEFIVEPRSKASFDHFNRDELRRQRALDPAADLAFPNPGDGEIDTSPKPYRMSPLQGNLTSNEKRQLELEFADMYRSIHAPSPTTSNRPANQPRNSTSASAPTNEPAYPTTLLRTVPPPRQYLQYEPYALDSPAQRNGFIIVGAIEWDIWVQQNRNDGALPEELHQTAGLSEGGELGDVLLQPSQVQQEDEREFDAEFDNSSVLAWLAGIPDDLDNHNFVPALQETLPALPPAEEEDARDVTQPGMFQSIWADEPPVQHAAVIAVNNTTRPPLPATQLQPATQYGTSHNTTDRGASSNNGAMRRGSNKEVNKPATLVTDEHQGIVSSIRFEDRNRREMLPIIREEDVNDPTFPPVARPQLPSSGPQLGHKEGVTQQATRAAVPNPSPHSDIDSAISAETYHSAYHRPNHYTGRS
ncbi:hypothetical protein TI39_contig426g00020 [Zymoseptoria brevis]|uniref:Uncharacterized protein n=1 Tax=Zymoseptoria brevis TaxID=1047168 RepID=A0A0F4GLV8_9PEZI|nr:hypothetical protein TI39_contig426g00020 [Zymoseptoria brevis]